MLRRRQMLAAEGVTVVDVCCHWHRSPWSAPEQVTSAALIFVRRGCFRRRADGVETVLDPTTVYFQRPGTEQQIAHPTDGGDRCTAIALSADLLSRLWGEPILPVDEVHTSRELDLAHRRLVADCSRGDDPAVLAERAIELVATTLALVQPERVLAGRPRTDASRRRAVRDARELLACRPSLALTELAGTLHISPHHLSRIFRALTGEPVSRYRNRLRVRTALERVALGEPNLARLAAELGFADGAHLARAVREEAGDAPSRLRAALAYITEEADGVASGVDGRDWD